MQTGLKGNYEKASNLLETMLQVEPDNGDALWFMGFLDAEMGNNESAISRWQ
jgi:cytochrome c-type biogenesis protein CcmH/NrfG